MHMPTIACCMKMLFSSPNLIYHLAYGRPSCLANLQNSKESLVFNEVAVDLREKKHNRKQEILTGKAQLQAFRLVGPLQTDFLCFDFAQQQHLAATGIEENGISAIIGNCHFIAGEAEAIAIEESSESVEADAESDQSCIESCEGTSDEEATKIDEDEAPGREEVLAQGPICVVDITRLMKPTVVMLTDIVVNDASLTCKITSNGNSSITTSSPQFSALTLL